MVAYGKGGSFQVHHRRLSSPYPSKSRLARIKAGKQAQIDMVAAKKIPEKIEIYHCELRGETRKRGPQGKCSRFRSGDVLSKSNDSALRLSAGYDRGCPARAPTKTPFVKNEAFSLEWGRSLPGNLFSGTEKGQ